MWKKSHLEVVFWRLKAFSAEKWKNILCLFKCMYILKCINKASSKEVNWFGVQFSYRGWVYQKLGLTSETNCYIILAMHFMFFNNFQAKITNDKLKGRKWVDSARFSAHWISARALCCVAMVTGLSSIGSFSDIMMCRGIWLAVFVRWIVPNNIGPT